MSKEPKLLNAALITQAIIDTLKQDPELRKKFVEYYKQTKVTDN